MKTRNITLSNLMAIASLAISAASLASLIWIGGFRFSALLHEVKDLKEDVQKLEVRMEKRFEKVEDKIEDLRLEIHKMDVRLTAVEQHKH